MLPKARKNALLIQEAGDELFVYDTECDRAHALSRAAALVWSRCDGNTTVEEIAGGLQQHTGSGDSEVVWMILRRLAKMRLLEESLTIPMSAISSSRRELIRKLAVVGGVVACSIGAPTAAQAATNFNYW